LAVSPIGARNAACANACPARFDAPARGVTSESDNDADGKETNMYIGGGVLAVILIVLLLIWLL